MRRILLLLLLLAVSAAVYPQDDAAGAKKKTGKFHAGLVYSYLNTDLKVSYLSMHSVWQGQDFGTNVLTDDEIDTINSYVTRTSRVNVFAVEAGMVFFDSPGGKWHIAGSLLAGLGDSFTRIYNKETGREEQTFNSGYMNPVFGVTFDFAYRFTPHWQLSFRPSVNYLWGIATDIKDENYPPLVNYTEDRKDRYVSLYHRATLMAAYTIGNFTVSAGPGYYLLFSTHKYTIDRTNNEAGYVLSDEFTWKYRSTYHFDGAIALEWRIIDALTLSAFGAIGQDVVVNAGLQYNF